MRRVLSVLPIIFLFAWAPLACGPFSGTTQPSSPDALKITEAFNRSFAVTERAIAQGFQVGVIPESSRPAMDEGIAACRRWLDQMGIDARSNNQLSFQSSLREFSVALSPLIVKQLEVETQQRSKSAPAAAKSKSTP